jgi:hypothetical protein
MKRLTKRKTRLFGVVFGLAVVASQAGMLATICGFKWGG